MRAIFHWKILLWLFKKVVEEPSISSWFDKPCELVFELEIWASKLTNYKGNYEGVNYEGSHKSNQTFNLQRKLNFINWAVFAKYIL